MLLAETNRLDTQAAKSLGAYYTDTQVADFLVWWAVRDAKDTVIDPSFGGGVFLRSACKRLLLLGGNPEMQVGGIEISPEVHGRISQKLTEEFGLKTERLKLADFFAISSQEFPNVDAVVGNPPFIRYQRFTGEQRQTALKRSLEQGVRLNGLSSSWAPFVVHSVGLIKRGGRMAMVVPYEMAHASYARPILNFLTSTFETVTILSFRKKLFPELNEATLLLLAENKGGTPRGIRLRDTAHAGELLDMRRSGEINPTPIDLRSSRLVEHFIPEDARNLYRELREARLVVPLGEIADVGIGYVTGANSFFHLTPETVHHYSIPERLLKPAVKRGRSLSGLRFTHQDWTEALKLGEAGYLLHIPGKEIPTSVEGYIKTGEAIGVPLGFKCRNRSPWYAVPHVYQPDAFLTYMSGDVPRLVSNEANVVAPNSLHILRMHPSNSPQWDARTLTALWQTSLTRLSCEIVGHPLGGGMLKMEPREAENALIPTTKVSMSSLAIELDLIARAKGNAAAEERANLDILRNLGLTSQDCNRLMTAADTLRARRKNSL